MLKFDLNLQVQYGFFFGELPDELPLEKFEGITDLLSRPVAGASQPRLIFKTRRLGEAITGGATTAFEEAQLQRIPVVSWSGPTVRAAWNPTRFDLFVDARSIEELSGSSISIQQITDRVAANLAATAKHFQFPVNRAVLAVQGEATVEDPAKVVKKHFFAPRYADENYIELLGRTNSRASWSLGGDRGRLDMSVNRIEQGEARWTLKAGGQTKRTLAWLFDVNTSPDWATNIDPDLLPEFWSSATKWVSDSLELIDA